MFGNVRVRPSLILFYDCKRAGYSCEIRAMFRRSWFGPIIDSRRQLVLTSWALGPGRGF